MGETPIAGRYRLVERLGRGGTGEVWRAHDERLDRTVALKRLLPGGGPGDDDQATREARLTARIRHPHAVAVHDVVEHDGRPCLVMEYVPARSLTAVLAERGTLPPERVARIGHEIAGALAAAHEAGVVHRDVKPDNVLLTDDAGAKLTDFGIARAVGDGASNAGVVAGTPAYLAPELAAGGPASFVSDVFSLGSTLYAAVEGRPPFGFADDPSLLLRTVAEGVVAPPRQAGPLGPVLSWLLRRDPAQRPTTTQAAEALGGVAAGRTVVPPQPTLVLPGGGGSRVRRRTVVGGLAAVGLVAVGVVTGVLIAGGSPNTSVADRPPTAHTRAVPVPPVSTCAARYELVNAWPGGYQARVTVSNAGRTKVDGWTVTLELGDGQRITQLWNGALSGSGGTARVASLSYDAVVSAGGSTMFGFLGASSGSAPVSPAVRFTTR